MYEEKVFNANLPLNFEICFSKEIRNYELKTIQTYKLDTCFIEWLFEEPTHDLDGLLRDIIYMFNNGKPLVSIFSTDHIELQFCILRKCANDIDKEEEEPINMRYFYKSIFYSYYIIPIILSQPQDESDSSEQDRSYKNTIIDFYVSNFRYLKENFTLKSLKNIFKFGFDNHIFNDNRFINWIFNPTTFADHVEKFLQRSFLDNN